MFVQDKFVIVCLFVFYKVTTLFHKAVAQMHIRF